MIIENKTVAIIPGNAFRKYKCLNNGLDEACCCGCGGDVIKFMYSKLKHDSLETDKSETMFYTEGKS